MALDAQILLSILAHETSSGDISRTLRATPASYSLTLGDGTGANQAQVVWSDSRTTSTSSQDSLNLANLSDDRGVVSFTAIKAMYVRNAGNAAMLWDGGSWSSGPLSAPGDCAVAIQPGGCVVFIAPTATGFAVGSSPQTIDFGASGSPTQYEIILIGEGTVT